MNGAFHDPFLQAISAESKGIGLHAGIKKRNREGVVRPWGLIVDAGMEALADDTARLIQGRPLAADGPGAAQCPVIEIDRRSRINFGRIAV
jgi:hypothetical protein